jgi:hypothetical protein
MNRFPLIAAALLISLFIGTSATVIAQDKHEITIDYDRFKDETRVALDPIPTSAPIVFVAALFDCPGQSMCKPGQVVLGFAIVNLSDEYNGQGVIRMIRDGVRQGPHQLRYMGTAKPNPAIPLPSHLFRILVTANALTEIANSKKVEIQIDRIEFSLTAENLAGLRDLAGRMQP